MHPTATHKLRCLTNNVAVSQWEIDLWNKIMSETVNLKLKVTKCHLTVLLLMKLKGKNIGTNVIEQYVKNEARTDKLKLKNRRILLNLKLENARSEELKARSKYDAKMKYLSKRWGHYVNIMSQIKVIMQNEMEIAWKD